MSTMPKKNLYPLSPSFGKLETILIDFYKNGNRPNGGKGWPDRTFPVEHYRYIGIKGCEAEPNKIIDKNSVKLIFHCDKHNVDFETNLRKLFNGSPKLPVILCKHCANELSYGKTLYTFKSLRELFTKHAEFPFTLELPLDTPDLAILTTKDPIPIRCTKAKFGEDIPCNKLVAHKIGNVKYAMENPDKERVICCQGECDSKAKGKAKRKKLDCFIEEIKSKTKGKWTFSPDQNYSTSTQEYWFTHQCGFPVYTCQYKLLNVDGNDKIHDCPCCDESSPINLIEGRLDLFQVWLDSFADNKLECLSKTLPASTYEELSVQCRKCHTPFNANIENIRTSKHRGCELCFKEARNFQRVQAVDSECETRRGFTVVGELALVDETYDFISQSGEIFTGTLIELCKKYPVGAGGISQPTPKQDTSYAKVGLPYSNDDIALMHKLANTMSYADMTKYFERSPGSLKTKFRKLGLRNDLRPNYRRLTTFNDSVFNDITPESSYWAGLLAADGCVHRNGRYITIELQAKDELHLGRLLEYLGSDGKLTYRTLKIVEGRNLYAKLHVNSTEIIEALKRNFNLIPAKSLVLEPPLIEDIQCREAFMLGLFDGDGGILRKVDGQLRAVFTTASKSMAYWYFEEVKRILDKSGHPSPEHIKNEGKWHYKVTVHTQEVSRFLGDLYSSVELGLERKFRIYDA